MLQIYHQCLVFFGDSVSIVKLHRGPIRVGSWTQKMLLSLMTSGGIQELFASNWVQRPNTITKNALITSGHLGEYEIFRGSGVVD